MDQVILRHVTKRFTTKTLGDIVAVDDFNLSVHEGECFSFLGPSGCGKSTTLRMIAGFEDLSEGEIELCGRPVSIKDKNLYVPPEERGLGMVFQSFAVWPHMNVFDNVAFPLQIQKVNKTEIAQRVKEAMMDFAAPAFGRGCFGRIFRQSVRRLFRAGLAGVWQQFRADLAARAGPWRTDIAVWLYHTLHHRRPYRHRTGIFSLPPAVK